MATTNTQIIRNFYANLGKGDMPSVLGTFDDGIEWTEAAGFPYGGQYTGQDEIVENVIKRLVTEWDGFTVSPVEYIDAGERTVVLGKYTGTYKDTGKKMEADFAHIWTLRDGKAVKFVQYADTALVQEALQK